MAADNEIQLDRLARSFAAVGELIDAIQPDQWSAPTQCMDWTVHRLVEHLVGKNLVFAAVLAEQPPPQRGDGVPSDQLARAYRESAAVLLDAFGQPGVLDRSYQGPLGAATGAERLKIRMYDLLAHGWDLARAVGQPFPADNATIAGCLEFIEPMSQPDAASSREPAFGPPLPAPDSASKIDRLIALTGRDPAWIPD